MVEQWLAALAASSGFAILYGVPRWYVPAAGAVGMLSWAVVLFLEPLTGDIVSLLIGAAAAAGSSEWLARRLRQPTTLFVIPGVIPLVPGGLAYMTVLHFLQGSTDTGLVYLIDTFFASGAIAVGIIMVSSLFRMRPVNR